MQQIRKSAAVQVTGVPDEEQLAKINQLAKSPLQAEEVYVFSMRLCDDQPDRDGERFATEALPKLAELFRGRTGIADHNWSSDRQTARIFDTSVEVEKGVSYIRAWAYLLRTEKNADLIREIDAGIKKEVSVGCAMGSAICSVCGSSYGTCEHRKGEHYGTEVCCTVLSDPLDAYEFSFVAVPAQRSAGVTKQFSTGVDNLEADAALGRSYLQKLRRSVVTLGLTLDVGLRAEVLEKVAEKLGEQELLLLQEGFSEKAAALFPPAPQLGWRVAKCEQDDAFRI